VAYHEVPPDVLENAPELTSWARKAIGIAANHKKLAKGTRLKRSKEKPN
jgi:TfoX/Sxy family transcriptional regulator of competence genes